MVEKVLKLINDNQVFLKNGTRMTPLTQVEIAERLGVSKVTINGIFKALKVNKLISPSKDGRGRYYLSDGAMTVIKQIDIIGALGRG